MKNSMRATNSSTEESLNYLSAKCPIPPTIAVVLGSGLGDFAQQIINPIVVPTSEIPNYPVSTVHGHAGKIIFGAIEKDGRKSSQLIVFQGRVHLYESNNISQVVYPMRIAAALGTQQLIVTNAAGGINRHFESGTLMFIRDYINLTGEHPLMGIENAPEVAGTRIGPPLDRHLLALGREIGSNLGIATKEGVYCWTKGPTYETAAEIRMMNSLGADAVGMSTVPEIIVAHYLGLRVLGISCITNMATGISLTKLSHDEVTETADRVKSDFTNLVSEMIFAMSDEN